MSKIEFTGQVPEYRQQHYDQMRQRQAPAAAPAAPAPAPAATPVPRRKPGRPPGPSRAQYPVETASKQTKRRMNRLKRYVGRKTKSLNVRVDDTTFAALTALQEACGMPRAQLVGHIILHAFTTLYPTWQQLAQLRAMGVGNT